MNSESFNPRRQVIPAGTEPTQAELDVINGKDKKLKNIGRKAVVGLGLALAANADASQEEIAKVKTAVTMAEFDVKHANNPKDKLKAEKAMALAQAKLEEARAKDADEKALEVNLAKARALVKKANDKYQAAEENSKEEAEAKDALDLAQAELDVAESKVLEFSEQKQNEVIGREREEERNNLSRETAGDRNVFGDKIDAPKTHVIRRTEKTLSDGTKVFTEEMSKEAAKLEKHKDNNTRKIEKEKAKRSQPKEVFITPPVYGGVVRGGGYYSHDGRRGGGYGRGGGRRSHR